MDSVAIGSVKSDMGRISGSWKAVAGPGDISGHAEYFDLEATP